MGGVSCSIANEGTEDNNGVDWDMGNVAECKDATFMNEDHWRMNELCSDAFVCTKLSKQDSAGYFVRRPYIQHGASIL